MDNGMQKKGKDMLMGASSLPGREMDISRLINRTKEIDCRNTMFIDRADIIPNPENEKRFPQVDIEELSEWIYFRKKLYHDLIVIPVDGTGKYMLVDGERRHRAILLLDDRQYSEVFPLGVNCCVFPASTDSTLLRLDSTLANYLQRHTDVYLRRQEILDMYECLLDLRERKMADTDVISHMSDILGIKERQLKKYINTADLIPEFERMLKDNRITLNEAAKIASFDGGLQMELYRKQSENGGITPSDYNEAEDMNRVIKSEQELAVISDSIDSNKELYEAEVEKSRLLAQNTKDREKLKRQEKRELKAKQRLEKEESRYCSMAGGLKTARKSQMSFPGDTGSDIKKQDIKPVILQAELCLKKFEEYPELLADDDAILESLKDISIRFSALLEHCRKIQEAGNICPETAQK